MERAISTPIFLINMAFPPIYNTREMANYARESFIWRWRSASRLPSPLPEDFHALCPRFSLSEAEGAAADFELPEILQATFYAMLLNGAVESRGMAKTMSTPRIRSPDKRLVEGTQGGTSSSSSSDHSSRSLSSEGASTSSSSPERPSAPSRSRLWQRSRNSQNPYSLGSAGCTRQRFPNSKVVPRLKRSALEKQYLLPAGYTFVILEVGATVNEPPTKCIAVYRAALNYDLRFPLHLVIVEILNKYELAPAWLCPHHGTTFAPSSQLASCAASLAPHRYLASCIPFRGHPRRLGTQGGIVSTIGRAS
ncbi:hypothetical protein Cgig2_014169 [Carnegiea gigantea]|uniref:Uncharacterized protein n=1 Tax=Carnegiea gigantea TaxID=171969 RepID=A0A9Q1K7Y7_9CARY|nr:hypothetical protein Cgig2_014169 [Carnegiea gigantea]